VNQDWFEMADVRKRKLDEAVWVPLRVNYSQTLGKTGYLGYRSELLAVGSVAIPLEKKAEAESLGWHDLRLLHSHKGGFDQSRYIPGDIFEDTRIGQAIPLALEQTGNSEEPQVWHLHQDFVLTLGLKREGDVWLAMDDGYIEVARLKKERDDKPTILEVRAEYLKDYLCARRMALYVSSYRSREEVMDDASQISWPENPFRRSLDGKDSWEGRVLEIHEGGHQFGASIKVLHVGRTNVDFAEDVPKIDYSDEDIVTNSWTNKFEGKKLHRVLGELWRNEWVDPSEHSPHVRGDKIPASAFFITDSSGTKESYETLQGGKRWLWFRPGVILELTRFKGSGLRWYTRDTGSVKCSPDYGVVFGMNKLGMVNVYAKDIALLPEWQQALWAGSNVGPEGGVSEELLAAQAEGNPADTSAPEEVLPKVIEYLNEIGIDKFGFRLFREHDQFGAIVSRTHRFRSVDKPGFFSLAKDLARLTADSIDAASLQKIAAPPKDETWRSLKTLENVLAKETNLTRAHSILGPLHGVYNLRHADAHLPGNELEYSLNLAGVDEALPFVLQGFQILHSCVSSLCAIAKTLKQPSVGKTS
jgi:hypothetical protein